MPSASESLRRVALRHFAALGFDGTSLNGIAADAGVSKSSVLYHYENKEALFDAALRPALDALHLLLPDMTQLADGAGRRAFLGRFLDFLFDHRLAVATIVSHGQALAGLPVVDEADAVIRELARCLEPAGGDDLAAVRFGVAMAGATFVLVAAARWTDVIPPDDVLRAQLASVLGDLVLDQDAVPV